MGGYWNSDGRNFLEFQKNWELVIVKVGGDIDHEKGPGELTQLQQETGFVRTC